MCICAWMYPYEYESEYLKTCSNGMYPVGHIVRQSNCYGNLWATGSSRSCEKGKRVINHRHNAYNKLCHISSILFNCLVLSLSLCVLYLHFVVVFSLFDGLLTHHPFMKDARANENIPLIMPSSPTAKQ